MTTQHDPLTVGEVETMRDIAQSWLDDYSEDRDGGLLLGLKDILPKAEYIELCTSWLSQHQRIATLRDLFKETNKQRCELIKEKFRDFLPLQDRYDKLMEAATRIIPHRVFSINGQHYPDCPACLFLDETDPGWRKRKQQEMLDVMEKFNENVAANEAKDQKND